MAPREVRDLDLRVRARPRLATVSPRQNLTGRPGTVVFDYDRPPRAPRAHHFCLISAIAFIFDPKQWLNNGEAHQGRAGPWPLACWKTSRCALTNRLPRVRRAHASPASPQDLLMGLRR